MSFQSSFQLIVIYLSIMLCASAKAQDSFQQKVDYRIQAELLPEERRLTAVADISYYNDSNQDLDTLFFHVWMNAFSDKNSAFAKQQLLLGNRAFHFSNEESRGGYEALNFSIEGKTLDYEYYSDSLGLHKDIVFIKLDQAIKAKSRSYIQVAFDMRIPYAFDRPGVKDSLFRMTQWYPKPAVFDKSGWHQMPYLSIGEFYSEYGDYDLELTIPISYSVAATGVPDDARAKFDIANRKRTLVYTAERVHDFAFFASETYIPYRESMELNDRTVAINLFVKEDNDCWNETFKYARNALSFLSENIIDYPYPQLTIIESDSEDMGGMEYPMLTILSYMECDQRLDHLIAHETAHQWFYSLLGSNERAEPWIDEGFASLYDYLYDRSFYEHGHFEEAFSLAEIIDGSDLDLQALSMLNLERNGYSKSIFDSKKGDDVLNYLSANYIKMRVGLMFLRDYMGKDKFDSAIRRLFRLYSHKHVYNSDVKAVFESVQGEELDWFFVDFIQDKHLLDDRISMKGDKIELTRSYDHRMPLKLSCYNQQDKLFLSSWYKSNGEKEQSIALPPGEIKTVSLNEKNALHDLDLYNNASGRSRLFPKVKLANFIENPGKKSMGVMPHVFYNETDGIMTGLSFYQSVFPQNSFRYVISPSYAFGSNEFTGAFFMEKDFLSKERQGPFRKLSLTLQGRRFNFFTNGAQGFEEKLSYATVKPGLEFHFKKDMFNYSKVFYRYHWISQENASLIEGDEAYDYFGVHQLGYSSITFAPLRQSRFSALLQYESYDSPVSDDPFKYLRLTLDWDHKIYYHENNKFFVRFFAGYFLMNDRRESSSFANSFTRGSMALSAQGYNDQLYSEIYFDRFGDQGGSSRQIYMRDGGFKSALGAANRIGLSNDYMLALNLKSDLPILYKNISLRPYCDLAVSSTKELASEELKPRFFYSAGFAIEIGDFFGLYIPLINSDLIDQSYNSSSPLNRLSFKLDLSRINPWSYTDQPSRLFE